MSLQPRWYGPQLVRLGDRRARTSSIVDSSRTPQIVGDLLPVVGGPRSVGGAAARVVGRSFISHRGGDWATTIHQLERNHRDRRRSWRGEGVGLTRCWRYVRMTVRGADN